MNFKLARLVIVGRRTRAGVLECNRYLLPSFWADTVALASEAERLGMPEADFVVLRTVPRPNLDEADWSFVTCERI